MESVIIYGGSFDPVHNGHLRIASAASMALNADVVFVPAKAPRWKSPQASAKQRVDMLRLAIAKSGSSAFSIDLFEMKSQSEVNYSIDLVRHIALTHRGWKIYLLMGADEANSFAKWKDPDEICRLATPLYVPRPGIEPDDSVLQRFHMQRLPYEGSGPVSSSAVRNLQSIDIPISVRDYIENNDLYYLSKLKSLISPRRLLHSISVANLADTIAARNHIENYHDAYIAGMLHDCAKNVDAETAMEVIKERYPDCVNFPEWTYHQFLSAFLAETIFGIKDPMILDAISCHATGKAHMTPLAKIIYSADKIEPTRGFDSRKLIDGCYRQYYAGFVSVLRANREYLQSRGYQVDNPWTQRCFDLYLGEGD